MSSVSVSPSSHSGRSPTPSVDPSPSISTSWTPPPPLEASPTGPTSDPAFPTPGTASGSSAALYLYTFLATLILLLAVSSAIVVRSLVLRRRHRQMVEEAIRNGTWIQPTNTNKRVDLSKKPKMHEAYIMEDDNGTGNAGNGHLDWASMTPFSLVSAEGPASNPDPAPPVVPQPAPPPPLFAWLRPSRFLRRQRPIPPEQLVTIPITPTRVNVPEQVHVAVIVAMPSPQSSRQVRMENEERELPPIQLGIVTVPVTRADETNEGRKMSSDDMV